MAKEFAAQRNLPIHYEVQDACNLPSKGERYDLIVDNYCLQCIVTDLDRKRLFTGVKSRLEPDGFYIIGTAIYSEDREYDDDDVFDTDTGVQYVKLDAEPSKYEDALIIGDEWYLPHRRHLKPSALRDELERHEFNITSVRDS